MKILILTALYPPLGASGHDDRCRQVVEALMQRGHILQVLTSSYRLPPMGISNEKGVYRHLTLHDLEDAESRGSYAAILEQELAAAGLLDDRLARFHPDVVYVWNMHGLPKSLLFGLQQQGIPVVYDLHSLWLSPDVFNRDPWFQWWKDRGSWRSKCYRLYLKLTGVARRHLRNLPRGDATELDLGNSSVCSISLRDALVASGVSQAAELSVMYPALNVDELLVKQRYRPIRKFMWAGRLTAEKAPGIAVRAVGILKERGVSLSLDIFGMGEPIERKAMRNLIDSTGLEDSVQMQGIRPGELVQKYADYDALLFTSCCNDPFPITPLEAMLSGLPCVLARDGGIEEVVKEGETALLYDAGDAEALANAMEQVMNLADGGEAMAKNCRERLQAGHSLSKVMDQIEAQLSASPNPNLNA
jgi:glycosyltransferase involved in cell wall biosynthesis